MVQIFWGLAGDFPGALVRRFAGVGTFLRMCRKTTWDCRDKEVSPITKGGSRQSEGIEICAKMDSDSAEGWKSRALIKPMEMLPVDGSGWRRQERLEFCTSWRAISRLNWRVSCFLSSDVVLSTRSG